MSVETLRERAILADELPWRVANHFAQTPRHHGAASSTALRDFAIAEVATLGADDLIVLVPLAGDQHDVARPASRDARVDRRCTIALDQHALRRGACP